MQKYHINKKSHIENRI